MQHVLGKEDSSASRNDLEDRACATSISSGFLRDPSTGRFSTSSKTKSCSANGYSKRLAEIKLNYLYRITDEVN